MKKINRLPREQVVDGDGVDRNTDDGLNLGHDVEGHRSPGDDGFAPRLPGTGGDFRRPSGGGEIDAGDDVEGHAIGAREFAPRLPGTGGDFRRPSGGGELDGRDDVEG
jgi:hypothetical protein